MKRNEKNVFPEKQSLFCAAALFLPRGLAFALICCCAPLFAQEIPVAADRIVKIAEPVKTICWNRDDSLFALGEADSIIVRDARSLGILHKLSFPQGMNLCFSREKDSDMILGVSSKNMAIWTLPQEEKNMRPDFSYLISFENRKEAACAAFSPNSNDIAVSFSDGSAMLYWKLRATQKLNPKKLEGTARNVRSLAFSPNSSLVAAASSDGVVYVWHTVDGALISKIDTFRGMRTPVVFSANSMNIYGCKQNNIVSLMSLDGKVLREVRVRSTVSQFTVTPDDKTLIVLTDDGLLEFYAINDGKLLGYIPPFNDSRLISFAFSSDYAQVLTGHQDGSVYKLRVKDVLRKPDEPMPETPNRTDDGAIVVVPGQEHSGAAPDGDNTLAPDQKAANDNDFSPDNGNAGNGSGYSAAPLPQGQQIVVPFDFRSSMRERFSAFNIGASAFMLDKKSAYYQFGTAVELGWYTTQFTAPVYEGFGARVAMAFPADNYPMTYKTLDGSARIAPPYLFFAEVFVPVGVEVPVSAFVSLFSEVAFEAKVNMLMNPGVTSSKQAFSLGGRIRTGIIISKMAVALGAEYDSMWGLIPEISVAANFKPKGKSKGGQK